MRKPHRSCRPERFRPPAGIGPEAALRAIILIRERPRRISRNCGRSGLPGCVSGLPFHSSAGAISALIETPVLGHNSHRRRQQSQVNECGKGGGIGGSHEGLSFSHTGDVPPHVSLHGTGVPGPGNLQSLVDNPGVGDISHSGGPVCREIKL